MLSCLVSERTYKSIYSLVLPTVSSTCRFSWSSAALIQGPTELKPDVDWYTIDIHRDQELLAKHVEMQYVGALTPPQWRDDTDYAS